MFDAGSNPHVDHDRLARPDLVNCLGDDALEL
jgi:hypothetical protein